MSTQKSGIRVAVPMNGGLCWMTLDNYREYIKNPEEYIEKAKNAPLKTRSDEPEEQKPQSQN